MCRHAAGAILRVQWKQVRRALLWLLVFLAVLMATELRTSPGDYRDEQVVRE